MSFAENIIIFALGVLSTLLVSHILPFEYKKWREDVREEKKEKEEWKKKMKSTAENVISIKDNEIEGAEDRDGTIDRKRVQMKMVSIADQLQKLKSSNPDISNEVEQEVDELINACREVDDFILAIGPKNYENFKDEVRDASETARNLKEAL